MDSAEQAAAAILLTAMLAVGCGLLIWAIGFFRQAATCAVQCYRSDLF